MPRKRFWADLYRGLRGDDRAARACDVPNRQLPEPIGSPWLGWKSDCRPGQAEQSPTSGRPSGRAVLADEIISLSHATIQDMFISSHVGQMGCSELVGQETPRSPGLLAGDGRTFLDWR